MIALDTLVADLCKQGVRDKVFTGASAAVSVGKEKKRKRVIQVSGKTRKDILGTSIEKKTFFDLASLTKPLVTTLLAGCLVHEGILDWEETLKKLLPQIKIPDEKKDITLTDLLSHSSGLPDYQPYYADIQPRQGMDKTDYIVQKIIQEPLVYPRGSKCIYSDLGFILLGFILEQRSGNSLDVLFQKKIAGPLSCSESLFFIPLSEKDNVESKKIAATEQCSWRKKIIQGEVHDEHCWLMNGIAGHAGLFGNIHSVLTVLEHVFDVWQASVQQQCCFDPFIREILRKKYTERTWCLGFDTPSKPGSSGGRYLSSESVGHLGYTGTSFWMDPEKECIIILLTNRVHPSRENKKIQQFRPYFHNRVMENIMKN